MSVFAILTHIAKNSLFSTHLVQLSCQNPSKFLDETTLQKLEGWGYCTMKIT